MKNSLSSPVVRLQHHIELKFLHFDRSFETTVVVKSDIAKFPILTLGFWERIVWPMRIPILERFGSRPKPQQLSPVIERIVPKEMYTRKQVIDTFNAVYKRFSATMSLPRFNYEKTRIVPQYRTFTDREECRNLLADFYVVRNGVKQVTGSIIGFTGKEADVSFSVSVPGYPQHREYVPVEGLIRYIALERELAKVLLDEKRSSKKDYELFIANRQREEKILADHSFSFKKLHPGKELFNQRIKVEAFIRSQDPLRRSGYSERSLFARDENYVNACVAMALRREFVPPA